MRIRSFGIVCLLIFIAGCALYARHRLDQRFGPEDPARFDRPLAAVAGTPEYRRDVKPILDQRCVVCHGCYDAPCQLQLGSYEGITRGASKRVVYDGTRLFTAAPTRLFVDADTNAEWRRMGFHPVLNERSNEPEANREGSVLYQLLEMKRAGDWPTSGLLPTDQFDFGLDRDQQCPRISEFEGLRRKHPAWGMPYALPPLTDPEHRVVADWIEAGAPATPPEPLPPALEQRVARWEAFLNGDALKSQLVARYIYEHWFLAHLYFEDQPPGQFFDLVRSKTPPGQPLDLIATRLPIDDPGVARVYYRLRPVHATLVDKTHMPYGLSEERLQRLKSWFIDPDYRVDRLPPYASFTTANPFLTFIDLPAAARYRFMLDEAQFTVMGFIKGPVCRGQVALNVINDHFWVTFVDPKLKDDGFDADFLRSALPKLRLPSAADSSFYPIQSWRIHADLATRFLQAKGEFMDRTLKGRMAPSLDLLWDGDGRNPNAALTVFRHFDSASVVQGLVGEKPKTVWVITYPILERIHYLLVASFDVFGNIGHQVNSRLYMDFLRMESEFTFLTLLPKKDREPQLYQWYRGARPEVKAFIKTGLGTFRRETGVRFQTDRPYEELQAMLRERFAPVQRDRYSLSALKLPPGALAQLQRLAGLGGRGLAVLPEVAFITLVDDKGRRTHLTLLHNSAHSNVAGLFGEENRRLPDEDTLTLAAGFIGAYPNAFYRVPAEKLGDFVDAVAGLRSEADYGRLAEGYAVRRTDPGFWQHSDRLHEDRAHRWPVEAAMFDYNRMENR